MHDAVPQWLPQAYMRAVQAAGGTASKEEIAQACASLLRHWSTENRHYHNVQHLMDTVTTLETLTPETHEPDLVRLAAWYHGVIFSTDAIRTYTRNGGEDEASSAAFARDNLLRLGVPEVKANRVAELICGIRSKRVEGRADETTRIDAIDIDLLVLRDAHLGVLAAEPQRYKSYLGAVRKEYLHIPFIEYLEARQAIVTKLLARPSLFITPMARQWETPTRENLTAELQRLAAKIEAVRAGTFPGDSACAATRERDALASQIPDDAGASRPDRSEPTTAIVPMVREGAETRSETREKTDKDTVSSLESCADRFEPGEKTRDGLSPEQIKQMKREKLAAEVRRRIEERQTGAVKSVQPKSGRIVTSTSSPSGAGTLAASTDHSHLEDEPPTSAVASDKDIATPTKEAVTIAPPAEESLSGIEREPEL